MSIKFFNTLTRKKETFTPLQKEVVTMYNCGPTVYDYTHIGNLRSYVFSDILRKTLELDGYTVKQVINITDVGHLVSDEDEGEDKIEQALKKENKSARELTEFYTKDFFESLKKLNIKTDNTIFPRATEHIKEHIALIKNLENKGFIYTTSDGVYFDTSKIQNYGALAQLDIEGLKEGARVTVNPEKKNSTDFALWKFSKKDETRQQEWESPWGVGFPGWHVECSAMSMKYLGETIDIHTGGVDHIPVHHTNEITQSEAVTGKPFVHYWLHNEFLAVDGKKMSKSLGNLFLLNDIEKQGLTPLAYRYLLLGAHYRTHLNFTLQSLKASQNALTKLHEHYRELTKTSNKTEDAGKGSTEDHGHSQRADDSYIKQFKKFLFDDLDTPSVLALLWKVIKDTNIDDAVKKATILEFDTVLGLGFDELKNPSIPEDVKRLVIERESARKNKEWEKSDELRKQIESLGFTTQDTPHGTKTTRL